MKIAVFHELPEGGARKSVHYLSKYLKKHHVVDLYTTVKESSKIKKYFNKVYYFKFEEKKWSGRNWKIRLYKDTIELIKLYLLHRRIAGLIQKGNYDIVFVHGSKYIEAPFLLKFKNKRKIFFLHDPYYRIVYEKKLWSTSNDWKRQIYEKTNRFLRKYLDNQNINCADIIIANSNFTKKLFEKTYQRRVDKVLYLGVDETVFLPKKHKKKFDVLFVGSKEFIDGYDTFLKVQNKLKRSISYRILDAAQEWISTESKMREIYRQSRIYLALGYHEPFGLGPIEAMACGIPVIAIAEGGYKETILHNNVGYLISRDHKKLSQAIIKLLSNKNLYRSFSKKSRMHVEEYFTWEISGAQLDKYFKSLLN